MDWKERTTYTAREGDIEAVVESPDPSGWCRFIIRTWKGEHLPRIVERGSVHGLSAAKEKAAEIATRWAKNERA